MQPIYSPRFTCFPLYLSTIRGILSSSNNCPLPVSSALGGTSGFLVVPSPGDSTMTFLQVFLNHPHNFVHGPIVKHTSVTLLTVPSVSCHTVMETCPWGKQNHNCCTHFFGFPSSPGSYLGPTNFSCLIKSLISQLVLFFKNTWLIFSDCFQWQGCCEFCTPLFLRMEFPHTCIVRELFKKFTIYSLVSHVIGCMAPLTCKGAWEMQSFTQMALYSD